MRSLALRRAVRARLETSVSKPPRHEGDRVTDIDTLAADYWAHYLKVQPTHAHLIGDYSGAGRFE